MSAGLVERPLAVKDAQQVLEVDATQGLVRAIVSVTGVVDEVGDIIEPGAYAKTLAARPNPKTCDGHDWAKPIGVAVHAEEWLPGDSRLPAQTKDGQPWPRAAGALVCDIQFNLDTERGEQAFKDVRFYSERGVAEWSIGYQVPPGKATRDAKGIRHIKEVDLYTVDPVLFGAAPLSMTLDIKSAAAVLARLTGHEEPEAIERKGGDPADEPEGMTAIVSAEAEGKGRTPDDLEVKYDTSPVGTPGGRQNWVDKVGGLPPFIRAIAHALIRNGKSEGNAIQIAVGTVQRWARGEGNVSAKTRAKAAAAIADWEKKKASSHAKALVYDPVLEVGEYAGHLPVEGKTAAPVDEAKAITDTGEDTLEFKAYPSLPGTFEERLDLVRRAVDAKYRPTDPSNPVSVWASVDGTTPDNVIITIWNDSEGKKRTVQMPYTVGSDGTVDFGPEEEVALVLVPQPVGGGDPNDPDLDGWLDTLADWMPPVDGTVKSVADTLERAMRLVPEGKAGRVLSGNNAGLLRQAVEHLVAVLKAAGLDINSNQPPADAAQANTTATDPTAVQEPVGAVAGKALDASAFPHPASGELLPGLPDPAAVLARIRAAQQ